MRPSKQLPTQPVIQPPLPSVAKTPIPAGPVALVLSAAATATGSAALLAVSLSPWQAAMPWIAAGTGTAAAATLLLACTARRPPASRPSPVPTPHLPAEAAAGVAAGVPDGVAGRLAALQAHLAAAAERLRTQQLEAMDAQAELAGAIVHDMNNALGAVAGYADFLVADLPAGSPQADYAGRILTSVERTRLGLQRLVAAARPDAAELRTERASRVLDTAAALLRGVPAASAGLTVSDEAGAPDPLCDAGLLARTLAGLAAEIAAAGGGADVRILLRASGRSVPEGATGTNDDRIAEGGLRDGGLRDDGWLVRTPLMPPPGLHVVFELRIDGPPPPPEDLSALTDPLLAARAHYRRRNGKRADAGAPAEAVHTAALQAARLHGGGLSLLTHPAGGTLVQLYVPAVPAAAHRSSPPPEPCVAPTIRVLVVESDHGCGDRFLTGLEQLGCEVSVCDDPRDALETVADEPAFFDAVVIGPGLGLSSGAAPTAGRILATRLKALRSDLPCVLYATVAGAGRPVGLSDPDGPADIVLPLPVDLPRLARGVAALAAGRRGGQAGVERSDGAEGGRH